MSASLSGRRGGSCLVVLIVVALVAVLVTVVMRMNALEREKAEREQAERQKAAVKSPEQLQRERINEALADVAPDLGPDPTKKLVDANLSTMKSVRDATVRQHATVKARLKAAEDDYERYRNERKALERKLEQLKAEFDRNPDDEAVGDELAQCDEDLENKKREILQAQTDIKPLKDYDYKLEREVAALSSAIRRCEADGRTIATAVEFEDLKKDLAAAAGAKTAIGEMRRNQDSRIMGVGAEVSGEKARKRERLEKYRRKPSTEE